MDCHTAYFYEDGDASWVNPIADFIKTGLGISETVIVIATQQHRVELKTKLVADKIIGLDAPNDAQYVTTDSIETLQLFMRKGWPDEGLFFNSVNQIIGSRQQHGGVRIYQEVTAILLAQADYLVGLHLEKLWGQFVKNGNRSFLCGYPASAFKETDTKYFLSEICACHSQNIGKEKCTNLVA